MMGSPWLEEYERHRPVRELVEDEKVDVAIIGGGISGLLTAYCLLESTDLSVTVLEREMVGHGATGHNGGQVVAAFEQGHDVLSAALGEGPTDQGYRELSKAWETLDHILRDIGQPRLQMVMAQLGIADLESIPYWAGELEARRRLGMPTGTLRLADDVPIPAGLEAEHVPRSELDRLLWTRGHRYSAALEMRVGLLNSYALVEELAGSLLTSHQERFRIYERSPAESVKLDDKGGTVLCNERRVHAGSVVLCTNGYRHPKITGDKAPAIEGRVQSSVGYMIGATSGSGQAGSRAYFQAGEDSYFYLTRREHTDSWLTAVGGPEVEVGHENEPTRPQEAEAFRRIEEFIESDLAPLGFRDHYWLGLMGYTPGGVRAAGRDPHLPNLYYNLGCNGIGLLSGVAGADRLARVMSGEKLPPSMFDPEAALLLQKRKVVQRTR